MAAGVSENLVSADVSPPGVSGGGTGLELAVHPRTRGGDHSHRRAGRASAPPATSDDQTS